MIHGDTTGHISRGGSAVYLRLSHAAGQSGSCNGTDYDSSFHRVIQDKFATNLHRIYYPRYISGPHFFTSLHFPSHIGPHSGIKTVPRSKNKEMNWVAFTDFQ